MDTMDHTTPLTYGSLFTGVGGFDLGFDQAGYTCKWQVEWDKHCQQTLAYHWPDVPRWSDVCDVDGTQLPPVDIITFGSPCQDLSVAGKRAGIDGNRSSMFFQAARIIKEMRDATNGTFPRITIWENVPGALSSNGGKDFETVLATLDDCGALAQWWYVLDAQHFGVPQRRRRIFLVAIFDPAIAGRCPNEILPVCEGSRRDFAKGQKKGKEVAGTLGGGSGNRVWSPDTDQMTFIPTATFQRQRSDQYEQTDLAVIPFVKAKRAMSNTDDDRWEATETAPTLNAFDNGGESRATVPMPIPIQGTIIGRSDTAGPQGSGIGEPDGAMYTLDRISMHGVAQPIIFENSFRGGARINDDISHTLPAKMGLGGGNQPHVAQPYSFDTQFGSNANVFVDQSPTLKASQQSPSIATSMAVRRLTPLECERLMGWPDNHTLHRADGKTNSDSTRYKMCGNGVATPVAQWIATQLKELL